MRAIFYQEFFEGSSRKFSKFESENEGNIFESFGNPSMGISTGLGFSKNQCECPVHILRSPWIRVDPKIAQQAAKVPQPGGTIPRHAINSASMRSKRSLQSTNSKKYPPEAGYLGGKYLNTLEF